MKNIPFIASMRPEPARDEFGRYILPDPGTSQVRSWTRATTLAHTLTDEFHLTQWKRRMVAEGLAKRPELLDRVAELARQLAEANNWREAKQARTLLDEVCDQAASAAGAEDGSKLGTLLHTITEYADAGRLDEILDQVPDELLPDLKAYTTTMDAAGIQRPAEWIERIVVNTAVESGGTLDRWLVMPDGRVVLGDLKTQKTVDFGFLEPAIQFAEYVNADAMFDPDTGQLEPLPEGLDRTVGILIHLPVGQARCTLYEVDLVKGWRAAQVAYETRQLRSEAKAMGRPYVPQRWSLPQPAPAGTCPECLADEDPRVWCDCQPNVGESPCRLAPCKQRAHDPKDCPHPQDVADAALAIQSFYLIQTAAHPDALVALWRDLDGRGIWTAEHTKAAAARKAQLTEIVF